MMQPSYLTAEALYSILSQSSTSLYRSQFSSFAPFSFSELKCDESLAPPPPAYSSFFQRPRLSFYTDEESIHPSVLRINNSYTCSDISLPLPLEKQPLDPLPFLTPLSEPLSLSSSPHSFHSAHGFDDHTMHSLSPDIPSTDELDLQPLTSAGTTTDFRFFPPEIELPKPINAMYSSTLDPPSSPFASMLPLTFPLPLVPIHPLTSPLDSFFPHDPSPILTPPDPLVLLEFSPIVEDSFSEPPFFIDPSFSTSLPCHPTYFSPFLFSQFHPNVLPLPPPPYSHICPANEFSICRRY